MGTLSASKKLGRLLAMAVGVVALILLASVLSESLLEGTGGRLILGGGPRDSFANPAFAPSPPPRNTLRALQLFSVVLWLATLYYAFKNPARFISILVLLTVVIGVLSVYLDDWYLRGLETTQEQAPITVFEDIEPVFPSESFEQPQIPREVPFIFRLALIGGFILCALFGSRRLLAYYDFGRGNPQSSSSTTPSVKQEALATIAEIESGVNFRNAIEECYAKMIKRVSESSTASLRKTMTPREFETVLLGLSYPKNSVERLTRLFEHTRYGSAEPTERERREAVACLQQIADTPQ